MIIYLYGPDSYRRQKKQKEIIKAYKEKHSGLTMDRFYLDEGEEEWLRFKNFAGTQSLFGSSRLAVASGLAELQIKDTAEFLETLAAEKGFVFLLSEEKEGFEFLTKEPVVSQEFGDLSGAQLESFLLSEAKKRDLTLGREQLSALISVYGSDTWGLVTELEKLNLSEGNYELGVRHYGQGGSLFNLIYRLRSRDLKTKLPVLEVLLRDEDPAKIFNLFAYSSREKGRFADYDLAVKSGKLDYETALLSLVL